MEGCFKSPHKDLGDKPFVFAILERGFIDFEILLEQTGNSVDDVFG